MINHVRTLLLNRKGTELTNDRYVDPAFVPVTLSKMQSDIRGALFPGELSVESLEERMRRYDAFLYLPDFRKYLEWLDPRLSYEPPNELSSEYRATTEFHSLFATVAGLVSTGIKDVFPSGGRLATPIRAMQLVWTGSIHDHEKFASVLFAQAFATEEIRSV